MARVPTRVLAMASRGSISPERIARRYGVEVSDTVSVRPKRKRGVGVHHDTGPADASVTRRLPRGIPADQINDQRFQSSPMGVSRGGTAQRPRGVNSGADHINQPINRTPAYPGRNMRPQGRGTGVTGGVIGSTPIYGGPSHRPTREQ